MGQTRWISSAVVGGLVLLCTSGVVRAQGPIAAQPVSRIASLAPGSIQGLVQDEKGLPLVGAMVSAFGATSAFAVTDRTGHFELRTLSPGPYLLRAHLSGFVASRGQIVDVRPSALVSSSIALRHAGAPDGAYPVATAGMAAPADASPDPAVIRSADSSSGGAGGDDHSETAWRVRHARKSILKDVPTEELITDDAPPPDNIFGPAILVGHAVESSARAATGFFGNVPFSGQVNLLTTASLDNPMQMFTADSFSRGVANMAVGAPVGSSADWAVRAALTQGDIASWIVAGTYAIHTPSTNRYEVGLSFAQQRYDPLSPLAVIGVTNGSRSAGVLYGYDTLTLSPSVSLTMGGRYARYDYLAGRGLVSPRVEVTIAPEGEHFRISAAASSVALAPGAEEFASPNDTGIWLPPQRTFSAFSPNQPFQAERTANLEIAVERDLADGATIAVRAFHQHVSDQLFTLFGLDTPEHPAAQQGQYLVGNAGNVDAIGWSAGLRTAFAGRVHGAVEYTQTAANWTTSDDVAYLVLFAPTTSGRPADRIHDVTASLETEVPETSTRVTVLYRVSNAFVHQVAADALSDHPSFDVRFDVQVRQSLPFMNFSTARWEALFAIRDFFRDATADSSVYDELLVVHPPKRIVGGLTLKF